MKLFGISIVTNNTMDVIVDKAVLVGHYEERNETLLNRIDTLMRERKVFESGCERVGTVNGILRDENTRLKAEIQEILETSAKGISKMAMKIQVRENVIKNQADEIRDLYSQISAK